MKTLCAALLLMVMTATAQAKDAQVGFQETVIPDTDHGRPLNLVVWYPTTAVGETQLIGDNPAFIGVQALPNAAPATGEHPLVVISHGYGGNWINQTWLASALARQGYIVAAPNHPGTTSRDRTQPAASELWRRPADISRVIDAITAQPKRFGGVANHKIAVIGHSLGGWTALEIGGARFDPQRFAEDCTAHPVLAGCKVYQDIQAGATAESRQRLSRNLSDPRVAAIVSLDLGLSRGFTDKSLADLHRPVLVIAAGWPSEELPARLESADLARRLPQASVRYLEISDATHFSFMAPCKPGAVQLIEQNDPGDGIICRDGDGGRPRALIQQQVLGVISEFLAQSL
ncbi:MULTISPECIES: alpha/beta fold hydrolase [Pseudomonas]|uniref:alpha/beta hydrolase family protein n=1 Tax=Pseudomonas TaxID=286 RepID=UPI000CD5A5D3|nr:MULTISPECIES: alpha/beta fold hydrolase [Pseudomonas]RBH59247.1 alpha/beta fold hydrolase [Pseudomonas sp. MWU13-2860]